MLTSSNQYLRPEYLTPLPTTLDAKKSPLALLAQTCSQIGADTSNSNLLQNSDKLTNSRRSDSSKDKLVVASTDNAYKRSSKIESNTVLEKSQAPEEKTVTESLGSGIRTPVNSKSSCSGRCSSDQSINSPRASPASIEPNAPAIENYSERSDSPDKLTDRTSPQSTSSNSTPKSVFTPNILASSCDPAIKDLPLGTFKPGAPPTTSHFLGSYPTPGYPLSMDLMTSNLMALNQHHALKTNGLSSYLGYGRIKPQDSLSSVCRDPYCTGCSVSSNLLGVASAIKTTSCPAGCTQCDHVKPPTSTSYITHSSPAAAYAHAQLAALAAASHLPYICNWISGDSAYCGKRFPSSEELLSHLRTHTSAANTEGNATLSLLSSTGLPPTHPLLHRTYPTPPLSPLATARYHPYNKPSLLHPSISSSSLTAFPISHPSLSPYLSPYSLYGPRLGAAPSMHP